MDKTIADSSEEGAFAFKLDRTYEMAKGFVKCARLTPYVFLLCEEAKNQYQELTNQFKNKELSAKTYHKKILRLNYCLGLVCHFLGFATHEGAKKKLLIESNKKHQPLQPQIKLLIGACDDY